jgi:hypothetical protein
MCCTHCHDILYDTDLISVVHGYRCLKKFTLYNFLAGMNLPGNTRPERLSTAHLRQTCCSVSARCYSRAIYYQRCCAETRHVESAAR